MQLRKGEKLHGNLNRSHKEICIGMFSLKIDFVTWLSSGQHSSVWPKWIDVLSIRFVFGLNRVWLVMVCDGLWWFVMSWNVFEWLKMFQNTMKCLEKSRNVNIWPNDCKQFVGRSKRPIQFYIFTKRKALNQHSICDLLTRKPAEIWQICSCVFIHCQ